jgi:hypothetical protein
MYHTGLDPMTMRPVETVHKLKDRQVQRALLQFFKPENWFTVRKALIDHRRQDLLGWLIPRDPPKEAYIARRKQANRDATHHHAEDAGVKRTVGYRPGRKGRTT